MTRIIPFLLALLIIQGCAVKQAHKPVHGETLDDKYVVLQNIKSATPEMCEYLGRINLHYIDNENNIASGGILRKECGGNILIRALGPFGMTLAEAIVDNNTYTIRRGRQDLTSSITITHEHVALLQSYLKLPPPMPDDTFTMSIARGQYLFLKDDEIYYVSPNFKILGFLNRDYSIGYIWRDDGNLNTMILNHDNMQLSVEFLDSWNAAQ